MAVVMSTTITFEYGDMIALRVSPFAASCAVSPLEEEIWRAEFSRVVCVACRFRENTRGLSEIERLARRVNVDAVLVGTGKATVSDDDGAGELSSLGLSEA